MNIFFIHSQSLETFYQNTIEYLNNKYHSYTTHLESIPVTETEIAEMSYYESLADSLANHQD